MVKINICSLFRDSEIWHGRLISQTSRFFSQLTQQRLTDGIEIGKVVCIYTYSEDDTLKKLEQEKNKGIFDVEIIEHGSNYGAVKSIVNQERLRELSSCGNVALESAKDDCDYIMFCESDLIIYDIFLLSKLFLAFDKIDNLGIIAPLIFLDTNYLWQYDSFIFRSDNGSQWKNNYPFSYDFNKYPQFVPMSSVGSCTLIKADLIRSGVSFKDNAYLNLCKEIREKNHKVYCDKRSFVYHPSFLLLNQRWI